MKKTVLKLWQRWQRFWGPTGEIPFIVKLLLSVLVVATVAVFVSKSVADCLQQLLSEKYDVLKVIGYCVAGVVSIWLAWAANKRANAIDATAKEQVKATENTEAGQRQERLKNAIEHLGHGSDSVRMGGAYELFHLAKDTGGLRQTVMDILCAHIRQTTRGKDYQAEHKTKPSEEMQGLLTLLFVQKHDVFENCSINLQGSYLNGATLIQARLKKANLTEVQLQDADIRYARLQGANLYKAKLQKATLIEARLQADLWVAQLQGADLMEAQLQEANLWRAQLQGADLSAARLQGAFLREAQLQGAALRQVQLQGANLINAQLQGATLWQAQMQGAVLKHVQIQGVSSHEADHFSSAEFESRIKNQTDEFSDLTEIIFAGGLGLKDLDALCEGLSAEKAQVLRERLIPHVKSEISHELPRDSGAIIGTYNQEEAEQWIAEYNRAMEEVPGAGDS